MERWLRPNIRCGIHTHSLKYILCSLLDRNASSENKNLKRDDGFMFKITQQVSTEHVNLLFKYIPSK